MVKPTGTQKQKTRSRPLRRRLNPAVRRAELLDTALRVLRAKGPANVRVEDITRAAGAAKGTFYLYFASWNDLLIAVREHLLSTYASEVRARFAAAAPSDQWPAFENECVRFVDFIIELGDLHKAVFHGPIEDQPINETYSADTLIAGLLSAWIATGVCRPVDVDAAAPLVFAVMHTTADGIALTGDREKRLESMLDLLRAWLRAP